MDDIRTRLDQTEARLRRLQATVWLLSTLCLAVGAVLGFLLAPSEPPPAESSAALSPWIDARLVQLVDGEDSVTLSPTELRFRSGDQTRVLLGWKDDSADLTLRNDNGKASIGTSIVGSTVELEGGEAGQVTLSAATGHSRLSIRDLERPATVELSYFEDQGAALTLESNGTAAEFVAGPNVGLRWQDRSGKVHRAE